MWDTNHPRYRLTNTWNRIHRVSPWAKEAGYEEGEVPWQWMVAVGGASIVLVTIPCVLNILVAYNSPNVGIGCRSASVILYWMAQVILVTFVSSTRIVQNRVILTSLLLLAIIAIFVSFVAGVGATIMQLTGLYRNCYCSCNIRSLWNPISSPGNWLNLASDTLLHRQLAATYWSDTGITGLGLLAGLCFITWGYQRNIKAHCKRLIKGVEDMPLPEGDLFALKASIPDSDSHQLSRHYIKAPCKHAQHVVERLETDSPVKPPQPRVYYSHPNPVRRISNCDISQPSMVRGVAISWRGAPPPPRCISVYTKPR